MTRRNTGVRLAAFALLAAVAVPRSGVAQSFAYRGFRGGMTVQAFRSAVRRQAMAHDTLRCEDAVAGLQACGNTEVRLRPDSASVGLVALLDLRAGVVPTLIFRNARPADSILVAQYAALVRQWGKPDGAAEVNPVTDELQWTRGRYSAKWQAAGANIMVILTDLTAHARAQQRLDAEAARPNP